MNTQSISAEWEKTKNKRFPTAWHDTAAPIVLKLVSGRRLQLVANTRSYSSCPERQAPYFVGSARSPRARTYKERPFTKKTKTKQIRPLKKKLRFILLSKHAGHHRDGKRPNARRRVAERAKHTR